MAGAEANPVGTTLVTWTPPHTTAGRLPRLPGHEAEMAWQAAQEACGSERVHVVWSVEGQHVYFLAAASADMAPNPGSWCPFAAVMPGGPNAMPGPVIYVTEDPLHLHALVVTDDGAEMLSEMPSRLRPHLERLGHPIIRLDQAEELVEVPWIRMNLAEETLIRRGAGLLIRAAVVVGVAGLLLGVGARFYGEVMTGRAENLAQEARAAALEAIRQAQDASTPEAARAMGGLINLNANLLPIGATIVQYRQQAADAPVWKAVVPPGITAATIEAIGGRTIEVKETGLVVVNR